MIRFMDVKDIPQLVEMGQRFFSESGYAGKFQPDHLASSLSDFSTQQNAIVFVVEVEGRIVGAIGGHWYPTFYNHDHIIAQEMFWWVNDNARQHKIGWLLLQAFEAWTREVGATTVMMTALEAKNPELVGGFYRRSGYKLLEHNYIKDISKGGI